jgi:hypothetical protein
MSVAVSKLSGLTVEAIIEKVRNYITKMTGNLSFATPNPALPLMNSENDLLETKFVAAIDGGKTLKTAVRLQKLKVLGMVSVLRAYVQTTSLGDELIILSSGFDVKGKGAPVGILPPPSNVRVVFGQHPGELIVRWGGVPLRSGYKVQISEDILDPASWADLPDGETGQVRLVVGGLVSGKIYWFRVFTKSSAGYSGPSDAAHHMAP